MTPTQRVATRYAAERLKEAEDPNKVLTGPQVLALAREAVNNPSKPPSDISRSHHEMGLVEIWRVYAKFVKRGGDLSAEEFKEQLWNLALDRKVMLASADMPQLFKGAERSSLDAFSIKNRFELIRF